MTPSTLLTLWLANWLVMSVVAVSLAAKNRTGGHAQVNLWELENHPAGLVALLAVAWPVLLLRLVPVALPPSARPRR
ncbi:hypothetical protein [Streptomyces tendae]|uniref:hypothetical protein n=1 Tax=Streptomyces tendae TaxID=1932 RepID=UPI003EB77CEB